MARDKINSISAYIEKKSIKNEKNTQVIVIEVFFSKFCTFLFKYAENEFIIKIHYIEKGFFKISQNFPFLG